MQHLQDKVLFHISMWGQAALMGAGLLGIAAHYSTFLAILIGGAVTAATLLYDDE
jgi:hypothetical protein